MLMNPFRKSQRSAPVSLGSVHVNDMTVISTKEVVTKDCRDPTPIIEVKSVNAKEYAKSLKLPKDDDYQLRDMIKAGQIPEEVPVNGMLNSQDPTDLSNQGVPEAILDRLSGEVSSEPQKPASEPVSTPEPTPTPSE